MLLLCTFQRLQLHDKNPHYIKYEEFIFNYSPWNGIFLHTNQYLAFNRRVKKFEKNNFFNPFLSFFQKNSSLNSKFNQDFNRLRIFFFKSSKK